MSSLYDLFKFFIKKMFLHFILYKESLFFYNIKIYFTKKINNQKNNI